MAPNTAKTEQITFYSYWLPAIAPGAYTVNVTPSLTVPGQETSTRPVSEIFHVGAPRCALTGSEVYSCYPPPGQIGNFSDCLPHIVFDRCTLPWERTIEPNGNPTVEHDPWLALILLTDADFETVDKRRVPPVLPKTLAEIRQPEANVIGPKTFNLAPYESDLDPCQTIDLPAEMFGVVMPRKQDLPYLAHVREVKTDNKETWSLLKEGKFSVVICNRFPETQAKADGEKDWGIVNTVCLVSLEGWGDYLNEPGQLEDGKTCRLLVLGSWRFTCQGICTFKSQMNDLKDICLLSRPQLKHNDTRGQALQCVNRALKMGFAPVNHDLRNDDKTISWYRGPLLPMWYERCTSYADISCADAALRYDPDTGMFDASYAAAWQLGRLLALQDQAFAQALMRFRIDYQRGVRAANTEGPSEGKGKPGRRDNLRDWYAEQLTIAKFLTPGQSTARAHAFEPPPIPATVQNWVGQAMLLYGVPFYYLVPDAQMLPPESIRFFYLNPEWINCLLQGACSVGRTSTTDELVEQVLRGRFFEVSELLASELRSSAKQAADRRRVGTAEQYLPAPGQRSGWEPTETVLHWPLSGYLLRSAVVESWIGLEAKAKGVDSAGSTLDPLQILRMDRLAPDLLLCIYNGKVTEIEVKQPPEAIHFGAATQGRGNYAKIGLRKISGDPGTMGDMWEGTNTVDVPMRRQRVVNVSKLAAEIEVKVNELARNKAKSQEGGSFTSAEFAVEMVESPAKVRFRAA